jgi:hypothetical protein
MSFYKKYELERLIADGEAKTFRAIESATGRTVFLHLFNPGGQALLADLKAKLVGAGGKPVPPLVEVGEFAGSQYAVTESSEPFSNLREWVNRIPKASPAPSPAPPQPAPRPPPPAAASQPGRLLADEPGDFTRLFGPAEPAKNSAELARPPVAANTFGLLDDASGGFHRVVPPSRPSGTRPATPVEEEMGDFTRAYGATSSKVPDRVKPPARLPPRLPSPPPAPPRRDAPAPPVASAEWANPDDTGAFTKRFGSGLSGEAIDIAEEQAKAARATANENRPFQQAGDFTRMFGPAMGGKVPAGPPPATPLSLNTSASGVFGNSADLASPVKDASDAPIEAESESEPGQYTGAFGQKPGAPEAPKPPEARKPAAVVPIAAQKPRMRPAAIAGVAVAVAVLLALIVVAVVLGTRSH